MRRPVAGKRPVLSILLAGKGFPASEIAPASRKMELRQPTEWPAILSSQRTKEPQAPAAVARHGSNQADGVAHRLVIHIIVERQRGFVEVPYVARVLIGGESPLQGRTYSLALKENSMNDDFFSDEIYVLDPDDG